MPRDRHRALLGKDIAFIPQEPMTALNPVLTIGQQFSEHLKRLGHDGERVRRDIAAAEMNAVHLPEPAALLDRYPHQLSGGMCQRVLTAMAFASDPALLIADEPTTALDVMTQGRIVQLLKQMQETHRTAVLFITHDLRLATQICDDIMVLYAGEPVEYGPAKTVFSAPRHPYTRALQLANPPLAGERRRLVNLPEHMPGLGGFAALKGCRFAPRCPVADPACAAAVPAMMPVGAGHWVRCSPGCAAQFESKLGTEMAPPAPRADARKVLLDVDHVSKVFPGGGLLRKRAPTVAVDDVSFQVRAGEFLGIVGESGSGKSTVAKLILGLETPSTGSILVDGRDTRDAAALSRAARIATVQMVFQDPQSALNPRRMVASLVTQAMEAGAPQHALARAPVARARAVRRDRPGARHRHALSGAAFGRPAPARQHRPRAVLGAQGAGRRRDRLRPRRLGAGADPESAAQAARRSRHRARLHLARPVGRALSVQPRAGHAPRQGRRARRDRASVPGTPACLYSGAGRRRAARRPERAVARASGERRRRRLRRLTDNRREPMKAAAFSAYGGPEVLKIMDMETPKPGPGEVLVEVHAASVNPVDWKMRQGMLKDFFPVTFPRILGRDMAGVVAAVGAGVTRLQARRPRLRHERREETGHACRNSWRSPPICCVPCRRPSISSGRPSLPLAFFTAWISLVKTGELKRGERILIHAAAGGVGSLAVQIAKHIGATVVATCSARNIDYVKGLGADEVIDYRATDFAEAVRDSTSSTRRSAARSMSARSRRSSPADASSGSARSRPRARRCAPTSRSSSRSSIPSPTCWTSPRELVEEGALKPQPETVLPLAEASKALQLSQEGHARGKIVVKLR